MERQRPGTAGPVGRASWPMPGRRMPRATSTWACRCWMPTIRSTMRLREQLPAAQRERDARQQRLKNAKRIMVGLAAAVAIIISGALGRDQCARSDQARFAGREASHGGARQGQAGRVAGRQSEHWPGSRSKRPSNRPTAAELAAKQARAERKARGRSRPALAEMQARARSRPGPAGQRRRGIRSLRRPDRPDRGQDRRKRLRQGAGAAGRVQAGVSPLGVGPAGSISAAKACAPSTPQAPVDAVAWFPGDKRFVTGGWDGQVRIWNTGIGQLERSIPYGGLYVHGVAVSPDGQLVAAAGNDPQGYIKIWDAETGELKQTTRRTYRFGAVGRVLARRQAAADQLVRQDGPAVGPGQRQGSCKSFAGIPGGSGRPRSRRTRSALSRPARTARSSSGTRPPARPARPSPATSGRSTRPSFRPTAAGWPAAATTSGCWSGIPTHVRAVRFRKSLFGRAQSAARRSARWQAMRRPCAACGSRTTAGCWSAAATTIRCGIWDVRARQAAQDHARPRRLGAQLRPFGRWSLGPLGQPRPSGQAVEHRGLRRRTRAAGADCSKGTPTPSCRPTFLPTANRSPPPAATARPKPGTPAPAANCTASKKGTSFWPPRPSFSPTASRCSPRPPTTRPASGTCKPARKCCGWTAPAAAPRRPSLTTESTSSPAATTSGPSCGTPPRANCVRTFAPAPVERHGRGLFARRPAADGGRRRRTLRCVTPADGKRSRSSKAIRAGSSPPRFLPGGRRAADGQQRQDRRPVERGHRQGRTRRSCCKHPDARDRPGPRPRRPSCGDAVRRRRRCGCGISKRRKVDPDDRSAGGHRPIRWPCRPTAGACVTVSSRERAVRQWDLATGRPLPGPRARARW